MWRKIVPHSITVVCDPFLRTNRFKCAVVPIWSGGVQAPYLPPPDCVYNDIQPIWRQRHLTPSPRGSNKNRTQGPSPRKGVPLKGTTIMPVLFLGGLQLPLNWRSSKKLAELLSCIHTAQLSGNPFIPRRWRKEKRLSPVCQTSDIHVCFPFSSFRQDDSPRNQTHVSGANLYYLVSVVRMCCLWRTGYLPLSSGAFFVSEPDRAI